MELAKKIINDMINNYAYLSKEPINDLIKKIEKQIWLINYLLNLYNEFI